MRFGVSYFGVRNPDHVQRDLDEMVRLGFDYVVLTFSENDHRFYRDSMATCVRQAHERGLTVWVDPWSVGGLFGGEAFTDLGAWDIEAQQQRSDGRPLPLLCPNSEAVREYLRQWIETVAKDLGADFIFWDEPHFYIPTGEAYEQSHWSCRCSRCRDGFAATFGYPLPTAETADVKQWKRDVVATLMDEMTAMAAAYGLANAVCVLHDNENLDGLEAKFDRFAANPNLQVLSTAPYPLLNRQPMMLTRWFCEVLVRACQRHGKVPQMWLQGFQVPTGQEYLLGEEMQLMATSGLSDMAIWSYLGTAYMSSHACDDSEQVWRVFTQRMQALRQTSSERLSC